jgi:hypothetical protein
VTTGLVINGSVQGVQGVQAVAAIPDGRCRWPRCAGKEAVKEEQQMKWLVDPR